MKECNGRGSQHIHMLAYGSIMPMAVSNVASVLRLNEKFLEALETQVRLPAVPRPGHDRETAHACLPHMHVARIRKHPPAAHCRCARMCVV